ncbi:MAG: Crp/Fnr family transcriptional regulator [Rubrivivax sp.]|nr:MAG: Crp/Fnr family transcriptional regulator [Rubrivivax sp.]
MFSSGTCLPTTAPSPVLPAQQPLQAADGAANRRASQRIAETLQLVAATLSPQRRIVRAGDSIYRSGDEFSHLHLLNAGIFKLTSQSADGREQVVGLKFRGDWLGFAGIAEGHHACDAVAMDTGEAWAIRYDALLGACARYPALMGMVHEAMSGEIVNDRNSMMSFCTLPADARVANFLRYWADNLARRGLRADQITLCMTRAEIGNYLGMTLETVSRALTRLAREDLICFPERGRRDIAIPDLSRLETYIQQGLAPAGQTLQ